MTNETMNRLYPQTNKKDSKEQLFTVKYEQNGVMYVRKVRANSIEDAISKVKDINQTGIEIRLFGNNYQITYVDKNGRSISQRNFVSELFVEREIVAAKRRGERVYYFVDLDTSRRLEKSVKKYVNKDSTAYVRKVKVSTMQDAISKAKDADVFLPLKYSKTFFSEQSAKEFAVRLHKKYQIRAGKDNFGQNIWSVYWD